MPKSRPALNDAAFNLKCRQFLESLIDNWEDDLEEEAKADATNSPSSYDPSEVAEQALEEITEAAVLLGRGPWKGQRDDDGDPLRYLNHYQCDGCGHEWADVYSCAVDDDCPECGGRHMSPVKTEDLDEEGNVVEEAAPAEETASA